MAKVKIKGLNVTLNDIKKRLKNATKAKKLQNEIGEFTVDRIVQQARSGKNERTNRALPKLSKSYIAMRMGVASFRTGKNGKVFAIPEPDEILKTVDTEFFEPTRTRSNLTFTGELLRSLGFRIKKNQVFIKFGKARRGDGKTNSQVFEWLKKINDGYNFIGLGKVGRKRVQQNST